MAEVIRYSRFEEYYSANKNFIYENTLLNFFLIETINKVFAGKVPLYKFFNVVEDNSRQIILLVEDVCLIYGNRFNEDQIHMLSDELEFKKFKRYNFAGSKQIIDALFQINNARYSMDKHRIIYKCQQVLPDFEYSPGKMQMGDIRKLEELAIFSQAFSKAYDGKETTIDECRLIIYNGIMKG